MDRRQIGLKLVLDKLGLPDKVSSFEDRLILQKAVYLAQATGVNLGYYYQWYLHGPYCSALADDGFTISADDSNIADWNLDDASLEKLRGITGFFALNDRADLAKKLELLASVHYLIDREQVNDTSPGTINDKLVAYDKHFTEKEVSEAIGELKAHVLLP